jgi:hypothetical protein
MRLVILLALASACASVPETRTVERPRVETISCTALLREPDGSVERVVLATHVCREAVDEAFASLIR